ncbi:MAG: hypothetical protein IK064_06005 [Clostridia bacterium]|nr:hypothetical protein [Clostridia bacterium]
MKKLFPIIALILVFALVLPVFGCSLREDLIAAFATDNAGDDGEIRVPDAPASKRPSSGPTPVPTDVPQVTVPPTAAPTDPPAPVETEAPIDPTDEPEDPGYIYSFDPDTMMYTDRYITFIVPNGENYLNDMTEQMAQQFDYDIYLMFTRPGDATCNTGYFVIDSHGTSAYSTYAYMNEKQIEDMFRSIFEQQFGTGVEFETIEYQTVESTNYSGIIYEFRFGLSGYTFRELLWSVITDDNMCLNVCYTWSEDQPIQTTLDSIIVY